jgi:hypothetical protein
VKRVKGEKEKTAWSLSLLIPFPVFLSPEPVGQAAPASQRQVGLPSLRYAQAKQYVGLDPGNCNPL